jgi:transaldolase / glucose-6-phosphate isomerase
VTVSIDGLLRSAEGRLAAWEADSLGRRIWAHDPTVWGGPDTAELVDRLGWLNLPDAMRDHLPGWRALAASIRDDVDRVVLLGMGGSSLAPEVFAGVFSRRRGRPELTVLDSTHPDTISRVTDGLDPDRTLFVVSSKSGGTLETLSLFRHFWAWQDATGDDPGSSFVAVTDPGSGLADLAAERGFRATFLAPPDVGGRYSALCDFGLLPAALAGIEVDELLDHAASMAASCGPEVAEPANPGLRLGALIGEAAAAGRDKLTVVTTPRLSGLGAWLEQLVAESLGKDGVGVVPVVDEPTRSPDRYDDDRLFLSYRLPDDDDVDGLDAIEAAGHPVVRLVVEGLSGIAAEMFRAELATAAAAVVMGVHPFDQPDVEAAKDQARALMDAPVATTETVPALDDASLDVVAAAVGSGGYVAVQAFVDPDTHAATLADLVARLREQTRAPVTLGIGPRYLHSTGQLHKGGDEGCVVLQLLDTPRNDLPVPETPLTFGRIIRAQADGDAAALVTKGRTVVRRSLGDRA